MPRRRQGFEWPRQSFADLTGALVEELKRNRDFGQPLIYEQEYPTGLLRVSVVWDRWDRIAHEDRTTIILQAYEEAEGTEYRNRIALASGLTIPEAQAAGMLPYQVIPLVRPDDPVTIEQCREAMLEEGASVLRDAARPELRFASAEEAEQCRQRLAQRLAASEPVWAVIQEAGKVDDWYGGYDR